MENAVIRKKITGLTITLNGERTLSRCLDALSFCDQVLVVDSFSTDGTERIAREKGAMFVQNAFLGYFEQIRFGLDLLEKESPTEWIVFVDCDEVVSDELKGSILEKLFGPEPANAYEVKRSTWYYDRFLKHGDAYPDWLFRVFRPTGISLGECHGHPTYTPTGSRGRLEGDLLHYSNSGFFNHMEKLNVYAQRGADSMRRSGRTGGLGKAVFHAAWRFVNEYLVKRAFLDGKAGFIWTAHNAWYTFLKYIRLDEGCWDPDRGR